VPERRKKSAKSGEITLSIIPGKTRKEKVGSEETASSLLSRLGINRETVLVRVSGKMVSDSEKILPGMRVEIISIISGG